MHSYRTGFVVKILNHKYTILVALLILWLTLGRPPRPPKAFYLWEHSDKIVHAIMFGLLFFAASLDWFLRHRKKRPLLKNGVFTEIFAWCALAGAVIELVQPSVGRSNDLFDFIADVAGIVVAWLLTPSILRLLGLKGE